MHVYDEPQAVGVDKSLAPLLLLSPLHLRQVVFPGGAFEVVVEPPRRCSAEGRLEQLTLLNVFRQRRSGRNVSVIRGSRFLSSWEDPRQHDSETQMSTWTISC